jgi:hypothetical protein
MDVIPQPPDEPRVPQVPAATTPEEHHLEQLFPRWVSLGGQSYAPLAREAQVSMLGLQRHATRFKWRERMLATTNIAAERAMVDAAVDLAEVKSRHLKAARELGDKALAAVRSIVFEKPADILKGLQLAIELERLTLGLDKEQNDTDLSAVLETRLRELAAAGGATKAVEARVVEEPALPAPEAEPPEPPDLDDLLEGNDK